MKSVTYTRTDTHNCLNRFVVKFILLFLYFYFQKYKKEQNKFDNKLNIKEAQSLHYMMFEKSQDLKQSTSPHISLQWSPKNQKTSYFFLGIFPPQYKPLHLSQSVSAPSWRKLNRSILSWKFLTFVGFQWHILPSVNFRLELCWKKNLMEHMRWSRRGRMDEGC